MTHSELRRLNQLFAQDLGRTQDGRPLYKWDRSSELFYLIKAPVDMRTPGGLFVTIDGFRRITWEQRLGPGWMVASWRDPGTPAEWAALYQGALPYPPGGMYHAITQSLLPQGCEPNDDLTLGAIAKIREALGLGFEATLARTIQEAEAVEQKTIQDQRDMIDSDWPAFSCDPTIGYSTNIKDVSTT